MINNRLLFRVLKLALKGLLCLTIVVGGMRLALEIDRHYQAPDWSSVRFLFECPPEYHYDGFGCIATDPLRMLMDILHGLIAFWPFGLFLLIGTAVVIVNAPEILKENTKSQAEGTDEPAHT